VLIEPFVGCAGYALRHSHLDVRLYDLNPRIAGVRTFLIAAKRSEILRLTLRVDHVEDIKGPQEAKWLIGWWLGKAQKLPALAPGSWRRRYGASRGGWGKEVRQRIADQLAGIRHWHVYTESYETAPDIEATWLIDPLYAFPAGRLYPYGRDLDYEALGRWCHSRRGQAIVCEQAGATWLPFEPLGSNSGQFGSRGDKPAMEAMWQSA
jgi:hypothetical protein